MRRAAFCTVLAFTALLAWAGPAPAANTMGVQPDGKVVLAGVAPQGEAGQAYLPAIVRFDSDGGLDGSFGAGGGVVDFRGEPATSFTALATTSRGIYAAQGGFGTYRVLRFERDGDVDVNFGREGAAEVTQLERSYATSPRSITPFADGSIFVGGDARRPLSDGLAEGDVYAHLLRADGGLSEEIGRINMSTGDTLGAPSGEDFAVLPDGSAMVTGGLYDRNSRSRGYVARLREGSLDLTFGGGIDTPSSLFPAGSETRGFAIAVDAAGRTIVAHGLGNRPSLSRFEQNGGLDMSFGEAGVASLPGGPARATASAIALQPDGKILLAGSMLVPCGLPARGVDGCWRLYVARFGPDGDLDGTFGEAGVRRVAPADDDAQAAAVDVAALADGRSLLAATPASSEETEFFVARLDSSGALDPSFGQGGATSYTPCQGSVEERRRVGCLSHARANLRAGGLAAGKPRANLRVLTDNLLDPMSAVTIVLPRVLRAVPRKQGRVKAVEVPRGGRGRRLKPGRISIRLPQGARGLSVGLRPGVLKRVGRVVPGHKLVFHVDVTFRDGSRQRITVRVAP